MTLDILHSELSRIKAIIPISKTREINGVICHIMGSTLENDGSLHLIVLEYDDDYREKVDQAELEDAASAWQQPNTNRGMQRNDRHISSAQYFTNVTKVQFGNQEFTSTGNSSSICDMTQWNNTALFTRFLLSGWKPTGIDTHNTKYMYLTNINLDGTYETIPNNLNLSTPVRFKMHPKYTMHITEIPITLTVGNAYPNKIHLSGDGSAVSPWVQINRVYLYDIWHEAVKTFDDPRMKQYFNDQELAQKRLEFETHLQETCPKGLYFLAIEYECDQEINIQIYSKQWLESKPVYSNHAVGYIVKPDQETGKLGCKLKCAIIQEPIQEDTQSVEAEIFAYFMNIDAADIVI